VNVSKLEFVPKLFAVSELEATFGPRALEVIYGECDSVISRVSKSKDKGCWLEWNLAVP